MFGLLRLAVPGALLVYFVWRSFRARIFLLGIPFLMYMDFSVFFDKAKPFWIPSRLAPADHVMLWLVITWVIYFDLLLPARRRTVQHADLFGPRLSWPEEYAVLAFGALALFEILLTMLRFSEIGPALGEAKGFVYLFIGYFLLRGMLCRASRSDTLDFLKSLVIVNTIAAGLFVLHQGLHLPVYLATEYQVITFMGQVITRSFYFMPQLLALALAYVFARRSWTVFWVGVLIVTMGALWVSYTRSLLVIAVLEFLAVLVIRVLKRRQAGAAFRRALGLIALAGILAVAALVVLPVQSQYFLSRINMATSSSNVTQDPNLRNRQDKLRRTYAWITPESRVLGQGFVTVGQDAPASGIKEMSSDLVWVPVLYRLGLLGVFAAVLVYVAAGWRAARLSLTGDGDAEFLALLLVALVVGTFMESFVSWTFLNPARYPMGFWVFALLAAEACRRRAERDEAAVPEAAGLEAVDA